MRLFTSFLTLLASLAAAPAFAQNALETLGKPVDGKLNFQPPATELMRDIIFLDNLLLWIITAICIFVFALIGIVIVRYNRRANPTPKSFTHNTPIEILWTIGPIVILVFIGAFSLPVLFKQQIIPEGEVNIKVTGHQWYWTYEYTDTENNFEFDSYMIGNPSSLDESVRPADADVTPFVLDDAMRAKLVDAGFNDDEFLLATDTSVVVPVGKTVVMTVTADDVIHSWTIPAFGVKQDAVPGRLAQLWFNVEKEGVYFGQCSELCGKDHAYMPITVKAVSQEAYDKWLAQVTETEEYVDVLALN
ncbi:cytochrome c oxidase subunit II [Alisedimentitalea sp. MJ-SS2]|uniref:cytochrome c oxidase subunit II n=1 Tax=Aliisedimentitalea sp. MJ-SS2 TaxID=3049795 RepID=UPI00290EA665|nr:cytochrome c oxidase subunit II [Alisedimentitalea sp. MJ-SS2]MDU8926116.1 cytochrome c oxidase subunit II [Alisedimentitalea sp. MJ-SS2]